MLRARRIAAAMLAGALLGALGTRPVWAAPPHPSVKAAAASEKLDFLIYDPTSTKLIGQGHYTVAVNEDSITISGRNNYLNGKYDIEHERLSTTGAEPLLLNYKHSFFERGGAPQRIARADPVTGKASCTSFHSAQSDVSGEVLQFPDDTYAGASVLVPIADRLAHNPSGKLHFHAFDCAPGPRIFELTVDVQQAPWRHLPNDDDLLRADARPVFGWFDVFLKPFVPRTQFWFDPGRTFGFMGGTMARYYGGPEIMLVRVPPTMTVPPLPATPPATPPLATPPPTAERPPSLPLPPPPAARSPAMPPAAPAVAEAKSHASTIDAHIGEATSPARATAPSGR